MRTVSRPGPLDCGSPTVAAHEGAEDQHGSQAQQGRIATGGFAAAFVVAYFVVRHLLDFVSRSGFALFAYWRIFVGALGLWGVLLFG